MLKSGVLAEPVLIGRERELEVLQQCLDFAVQGKGTTVFVSGEAGSGKTRLVNEFLSASKQKRDISQLSGWCLSNSGVPYFPFIEAFNVYFSGFGKKNGSISLRQGGLRESLEKGGLVEDEELGLKAWLMGPEKTEKSRELESLSPQAWKDSTFAAVTKALFSISAKKPTILFIDDLHWADTASLALLQYISRFIFSQRILVLGAFRIEDLNPDSEGRPHPLVDALRLMGRENLYKEIKLPNLRRPDVSLLAENMVGGRVQAELAEKLAGESQGNPLFIVEALKMLSEKGRLVQENERWRVSTGDIGIPTKIKDILLRRVDALKPDQRKILDVASVIGSKFDPELLGAVLAQDSLETLEKLGAIAKSTSLVACEGSNYRFDHAKVRDALYEEIAPPLRNAYHARVAERLESGWKSEKLPVGDLAFHYAQAGNKEKAVKYALAAGEEALKIYSGAEAIKHFRYVLDATAEDVKYTNERTTALEGLGDGLAIRGRNLEAGKAFEQLSNSVTSGSAKMRAIAKAIRSCMLFGDHAHALVLLDKVVEYPDLDRLEYARIRTAKGMVKFWGGKEKESVEDFRESLRVLEEEYLLSDIADTLGQSAIAYAAIGEMEEAIAAGLRAVALSEYSRNIEGALESNIYLSVIFLGLNLEKKGAEAASEVGKLVEKVSDPVSRASWQSISCFMSSRFLEAKAAQRLFSGLPLGSMRSFGTGAKIKFFMSSLISGALREFKQTLKDAIAQALRGAELAEETDSYLARSYNYGNLTRQYAAVGDMEQADKYYEKLEKVSEEAPMAGGPMGYGGVLLSKAGYFSSKGQWKEANKFFDEAIEVFSHNTYAILAGARQGYCWTLLQQGRFADAKLQFEKAKETLDGLDKLFVHSNVLGYFIAPKRVEVGKEFNMRLDLVNVAKNPGVLVRVEGLAPADFKVTATRPNYSVQGNCLDLDNKNIHPFTDEGITFTVEATKAGVFKLSPQLIYVDDLGETKTCKINSVNVTVQPASS